MKAARKYVCAMPLLIPAGETALFLLRPPEAWAVDRLIFEAYKKSVYFHIASIAIDDRIKCYKNLSVAPEIGWNVPGDDTRGIVHLLDPIHVAKNEELRVRVTNLSAFPRECCFLLDVWERLEEAQA